MLEILIHQIKDNLKNLKFIISLVLILVLFVFNAIFFSIKYQESLANYNKVEIEKYESIKNSASSLENLVFLNRYILKKPLYSDFIVGNKQNAFPNSLFVNVNEITIPKRDSPKSTNVMLMDWLFIISIIGSLLIFILTYDAISEEKEKGTLKLVFSNSLTNLSYILGKLFGVVISIITAILLGLLLNILIINIINKIPINLELLGRTAIFFLLYILFVFLFSGIGMFVSFRSRSSVRSLIILTSVWIVFTLITPMVSSILASTFSKVETLTEFEYKYKMADLKLAELLSKHDGATRGFYEGKIDDYKKEKGEALARAELAEYKQKLQDEYLNKKINQAVLYNKLCNISPIYLFNHIIEELFNVGINRDKKLLVQITEFQNELIDAYKEIDKNDDESAHVYFLPGYLSKQSVELNQIPKFRERVTKPGESLQLALKGFLGLLIEMIVFLAFLLVMFNKYLIIN